MSKCMKCHTRSISRVLLTDCTKSVIAQLFSNEHVSELPRILAYTFCTCVS